MSPEPNIQITVEHRPSTSGDLYPWVASADLPSGYACSWGRTKEEALAELCEKIRVASQPIPAETFYATPDGDLILGTAPEPLRAA